jgi:hypothetical protein
MRPSHHEMHQACNCSEASKQVAKAEPTGRIPLTAGVQAQPAPTGGLPGLAVEPGDVGAPGLDGIDESFLAEGRDGATGGRSRNLVRLDEPLPGQGEANRVEVSPAIVLGRRPAEGAGPVAHSAPADGAATGSWRTVTGKRQEDGSFISRHDASHATVILTRASGARLYAVRRARHDRLPSPCSSAADWNGCRVFQRYGYVSGRQAQALL